MIQTYYIYFERVGLILLLIQLFVNMRKNRKILINNLEVFFFILILSLNHFGYLFFDKSDALFKFYHASSPLAISCSILRFPWNKYLNILLITTIVVVANLVVFERAFFLGIYLLSIVLTIQKANKLVKRKRNEIDKSIVYIVIALDLGERGTRTFSCIALKINN